MDSLHFIPVVLLLLAAFTEFTAAVSLHVPASKRGRMSNRQAIPEELESQDMKKPIEQDGNEIPTDVSPNLRFYFKTGLKIRANLAKQQPEFPEDGKLYKNATKTYQCERGINETKGAFHLDRTGWPDWCI